MNNNDYLKLEETAKSIGGPTGDLIIQLADELQEITSKFAKNIFNTKEACKYLGIGKIALYRAVKNRQLACSRPGGLGSAKFYFTREDLDKYISRNYRPADPDLEAEVANWI